MKTNIVTNRDVVASARVFGGLPLSAYPAIDGGQKRDQLERVLAARDEQDGCAAAPGVDRRLKALGAFDAFALAELGFNT